MSEQSCTTHDGATRTQFHTAASEVTTSIRDLEAISRQGVDINQADPAGRTPLHIICSIDWYEDMAEPSVHLRKKLGYFLQHCADVNAADTDGITPLHLACTISESMVKQLLQHGADATATTIEKLMALHIAARARQSNIVGLLIASISQKYSPERVVTLIDAKDQCGRSPLYYACRSGRPESVDLLLVAGADPRMLDGDGKSLLDAVAEFENEQALWRDYKRLTGQELDYLDSRNQRKTIEAACGVKLEDTRRPFTTNPALSNLPRYNEWLQEDCIHHDQDTARVDEILGSLMEALARHGQSIQWIQDTLNRSIHHCKSNGYGYTVRCFERLDSQARNETVTIKHNISVGEVHSAPVQRGFEHLLHDRQYDIVESLIRERRLPSDQFKHLLELLVKHGFTRLISAITVPAEMKSDQQLAGRLIDIACQRQLPNTKVIRLLVEKYDIDGSTLSSGLRYLARGCHWWQSEEGIPYLKSVSAVGLPLGVALRSRENFAVEASRALIKCCGNFQDFVHSSDGSGILELAVASPFRDVGIVQDILRTGPAVTPSVVFATIENKAVDILDMLVQYGANPNERLVVADSQVFAEGWPDAQEFHQSSFHIQRGRTEWFPLHLAAGPEQIHSEQERIQCSSMISALLCAGADVFAVYRQSLRRPWKEYQVFPGCTDSAVPTPEKPLEGDDDDHNYEEWSEPDWDDDYNLCSDTRDAQPKLPKQFGLQTVLHGLLESNFLIEAILSSHPQAKFDIERRNPQGRTLLLSACRSPLGADASVDSYLPDVTGDVHKGGYLRDPFTDQAIKPLNTAVNTLLSLGADPFATDIYGKNALHHLFEAHDPINRSGFRAPEIRASLRSLVTKYPELVNKADNLVTYPLVTALQRHRRYKLLGYQEQCGTEEAVALLLDNGADPAVRDDRGNTALHYLADGLAEVLKGEEQRRLFQLFLDRGLDINALNNEGLSPIWIMLLDNGDRAEQRDESFGFAIPPAQRVPEKDVDAEVFAMFEKAAVNWDLRNNDGQTLLHLLARYNISKTEFRWKTLRAKGLDPLVKDTRCISALDVAKTSRFAVPDQ